MHHHPSHVHFRLHSQECYVPFKLNYVISSVTNATLLRVPEHLTTPPGVQHSIYNATLYTATNLFFVAFLLLRFATITHYTTKIESITTLNSNENSMKFVYHVVPIDHIIMVGRRFCSRGPHNCYTVYYICHFHFSVNYGEVIGRISQTTTYNCSYCISSSSRHNIFSIVIIAVVFFFFAIFISALLRPALLT